MVFLKSPNHVDLVVLFVIDKDDDTTSLDATVDGPASTEHAVYGFDGCGWYIWMDIPIDVIGFYWFDWDDL